MMYYYNTLNYNDCFQIFKTSRSYYIFKLVILHLNNGEDFNMVCRAIKCITDNVTLFELL